MKKISLLVCSAVIFFSCRNRQVEMNSIVIANNFNNSTPGQLYCKQARQWVTFDAGKSSRHIDKISFDESGRFRLSYIDKKAGNTGYDTTITEGTAGFTKTSYGHQAIVLHPQKGTCLKNNGGSKSLSIHQLQQEFSETYLWEKISLPQNTGEDFLILVKAGINGMPEKNTAVKLRLQ